MHYEQAERLQKLPPYIFVRLEELTAKKKEEGEDIIDFGIGDPDLPTPAPIVEAIQESMAVNRNQKYSSSQGEKDLREAIAAWYKKRYNVDVDPKKRFSPYRRRSSTPEKP
jgi:LL-diaminopimelate aminotransferase